MSKKDKMGKRDNERHSSKHIKVQQKKERIDQLLVRRGLAPHLSKAQAMIMAGEIIAGERRVEKASEQFRSDQEIRVRLRRGHRYVGRGGLKMESALRSFKVNPTGWICLDLGMSTGGFTDCLIQSGARRVYGVDVGKGLAHERLVRDDRVIVIEETHVQALTDHLIPELCDLCVADISFNSLRRLIKPVLPFLKPQAIALLLVKPQFELSAERLREVGDRGVVRDLKIQEEVCQEIATHLEGLGFKVWGWSASETRGTKGNQEYFMHASYEVS